MVTASEVEAALRSGLPASAVEVADIQGCGTSFEVRVVSEAFAGQGRLARHKAVQAAVKHLMPEIHALSIKATKTPEEEAAAAAAGA